MALDPVLSEIRRVREEYAQQFNGDLRAMMDDLRRRHAESARKSVTRQPKPRRKTPVASTENGVHLYGLVSQERASVVSGKLSSSLGGVFARLASSLW
jgi:hypothetical protein